MAPRVKITKEMVIEAAFAIARAEGVENINARRVAEKLGCSTQPVMYHFAKIEDLKRAVYRKLDQFHTAYLMDIEPEEEPALKIGLNYIRFGVEEPHLFRFLFQSGFVAQNNVAQMMEAEALLPVLETMEAAMGLSREQTKGAFLTLAMFVHGYASFLANNSMTYDEEIVKNHLQRVFQGAVLAEKEDI